MNRTNKIIIGSSFFAVAGVASVLVTAAVINNNDESGNLNEMLDTSSFEPPTTDINGEPFIGDTTTGVHYSSHIGDEHEQLISTDSSTTISSYTFVEANIYKDFSFQFYIDGDEIDSKYDDFNLYYNNNFNSTIVDSIKPISLDKNTIYTVEYVYIGVNPDFSLSYEVTINKNNDITGEVEEISKFNSNIFDKELSENISVSSIITMDILASSTTEEDSSTILESVNVSSLFDENSVVIDEEIKGSGLDGPNRDTNGNPFVSTYTHGLYVSENLGNVSSANIDSLTNSTDLDAVQGDEAYTSSVLVNTVYDHWEYEFYINSNEVTDTYTDIEFVLSSKEGTTPELRIPNIQQDVEYKIVADLVTDEYDDNLYFVKRNDFGVQIKTYKYQISLYEVDDDKNETLINDSMEYEFSLDGTSDDSLNVKGSSPSFYIHANSSYGAETLVTFDAQFIDKDGWGANDSFSISDYTLDDGMSITLVDEGVSDINEPPVNLPSDIPDPDRGPAMVNFGTTLNFYSLSYKVSCNDYDNKFRIAIENNKTIDLSDAGNYNFIELECFAGTDMRIDIETDVNEFINYWGKLDGSEDSKIIIDTDLNITVYNQWYEDDELDSLTIGEDYYIYSLNIYEEYVNAESVFVPELDIYFQNIYDGNGDLNYHHSWRTSNH